MYPWGILLNTSGLWYLEALEPSDLALPQVLGRGRARQEKSYPPENVLINGKVGHLVMSLSSGTSQKKVGQLQS